MKQAWSNLILDTIKHDVYVSMRARIALRKVNINLTDGAVTKEVGNIKEHKGIPVNVNDIIAAFSRGDEVHFNALYYVKTLTWAVGN